MNQNLDSQRLKMRVTKKKENTLLPLVPSPDPSPDLPMETRKGFKLASKLFSASMKNDKWIFMYIQRKNNNDIKYSSDTTYFGEKTLQLAIFWLRWH